LEGELALCAHAAVEITSRSVMKERVLMISLLDALLES